VAKHKWECHICRNGGKLSKEVAAPDACPVCSANFLRPAEETIKYEISVSKQAGGIKGDVVIVTLTNKRLIFRGEKVGSTGFLVGGIIGGAIEGAINAAKTNANMAWLPVEDIKSISEEVAGAFKGKIMTTVHAKDGNAYAMKLSKKEFEKFETAVKPVITP